MTTLKLRSPSFCIILTAFLLVCFIRFRLGIMGVISWDMFGYYLYLPATFLHHDPGLHDLGWVQKLIEQYNVSGTLYQVHPGINGANVDRYTMGIAFLSLPAFLIAHLFASILGFPTDGMSYPYQLGITLQGLLVFLAGMLILRKVLLTYFSENITSFILLVLIFGTNLLEMAYANAHHPHIFLFASYSAVLWFSMRWHAYRKLRDAVFLGLLLGWSILVRPGELIILFIPILWGVSGFRSFLLKIKSLLQSTPLHVLALTAAILLAGLPHLVYLKTYAGEWFSNTYYNPAEGFDFNSPHLFQFLFSFRKGCLVYTPLLALMMAGFYFLYQKQRTLFWPILAYFASFLFLYSSWTTWWFGNSFSQRNLIQTYPLLAIPLGYSLQAITRSRKTVKLSLVWLITLLVILNLFQTWQYTFAKILDGERMTKAYYCKIFGQTSISEKDSKLLLVERYTTAEEAFTDAADYNPRLLAHMDFEAPNPDYSSVICDTIAFNGKASLKMDSLYIYSPSYISKYDDMTKRDHVWIRASVWVFPTGDLQEHPGSLVISFQHDSIDGTYKYRTLNLEDKRWGVKPGRWNQIVMNYLSPEVRSGDDKMVVYFWYRGKRPIYLDDFRVEAWEKKQLLSD